MQLRDSNYYYRTDLNANDLAVLLTDKPFIFDNFVQAVCVDWTGNAPQGFYHGYVSNSLSSLQINSSSVRLRRFTLIIIYRSFT